MDDSNLRGNPTPMRLPIEFDIFYAAQGEFTRDCSKTRAMEQFLIDRAKADSNIKDLADSIRLRAGLLGVSPYAVLRDWLQVAGYGNTLELDTVTAALCTAWGLPTDEAADRG